MGSSAPTESAACSTSASAVRITRRVVLFGHSRFATLSTRAGEGRPPRLAPVENGHHDDDERGIHHESGAHGEPA